jgi:precorrin-2 dehydrogenase/sirohydrochlorin ferrochelatase
MLPVFLDVKGKLALVVGGGKVGRRKANAVLTHGGRVRLVCLEARPLNADNNDLEWQQCEYSASHLENVTLVFAAGTPEVNARVAKDARERGLWVNVASDSERSDFHTGAALTRGELVIAVSTGGAAPLLARRLRDRFEDQLDEAYATWVSLLTEMRPIVRQCPQEKRRELFEHLAREEWLDRIRVEGVDAVRSAMRALLADV